ncbi:phosphoribosyl-AMP cyclohydrolase [Oleiphilus sp. HI0125]|uniref:phosphoribosyl-AMP cyclohydrolase n=1 Tax=Oleiphilus sp. HI0125 TaxID=1822266 RepID=UPI0007C2F452|nr:phosphoribosyl-AMP cyclohydrolase [Oleiphilus sp. HI0125]KZZ63380.1 phosphoribosyl-AMP cyclohydrolase [Oleiphilus sp. HI0125]
MYQKFFGSLEHKRDGDTVELKAVLENLAFNEDGLVPVITQDASTKNVLMMAWMNKEAIEKTLETRKVTYWSRSRQSFWVKGESSGHTQALCEMYFDCDGDSILCIAEQVGPACHTLRPNCFYLKADQESQVVHVIGDGYQS